MKKLSILFSISLLTIVFILPVNSSARWVLYDNFDSGYIDPELWEIRNNAGEIVVEDGKAKFMLDLRFPLPNRIWLRLIKHPERIKGIRAKVKVVKDTDGGPQAVMLAVIGEDESDNEISSMLRTRSEFDRIECYAPVASKPPTQIWKYDFFYANFMRPIDTENEWFMFETRFSQKELEYYVSGLGSIEHQFKTKVLKSADPFMAIGTRNAFDPGTGETFIVLFDDIWVEYIDVKKKSKR